MDTRIDLHTIYVQTKQVFSRFLMSSLFLKISYRHKLLRFANLCKMKH